MWDRCRKRSKSNIDMKLPQKPCRVSSRSGAHAVSAPIIDPGIYQANPMIFHPLLGISIG